MHRYATTIAGALAAAMLAVAPTRAQDAPATSPMHVDLIVPATVADGTAQVPTGLCVAVPEGVTTVTLSRRPLAPNLPSARPLWVTAGPYVSTATAEQHAALDTVLSLPIENLGTIVCFTFLNTISREQSNVAQAYKLYAQVVTIDAP